MTPTPPRRGEYARFLADVKKRIATARLRAAASVNQQLLALYGQIGKALAEKQEASGWGDEVIPRLAADLKREFPSIRGFSRASLFFMRKLYRTYRDQELCLTAVRQLPWSHNLLIMNKIGDLEQRLWYLQQTLENGWSKRVLDHHKSKDRTTVEYSLRDTAKPIGVSAYRLTSSLPHELEGALPSIEQLERELETKP